MGETMQGDREYLTFVLDSETFAVSISRVREVLEFSTVTRVPRMPDAMRGVINLRGSVVPVMDLKTRFGLGAVEKTVNTCVIIVQLEVAGESATLGVLADAVQEVVVIDHADIEPPPKVGAQIDTRFICGMGKRGDAFLILLDIDRAFDMTDATVACCELLHPAHAGDQHAAP